MFLRDRRAVVLSIVLPVIVMPLMLFGSHWAEQRREKELAGVTYKYTVIRDRQNPPSDADVTAIMRLVEQAIAQRPEPQAKVKNRKPAKFAAVPAGDEAKRLADGKLDVYLEVAPPLRRDLPATKSQKQLEKDPERQGPFILPDRTEVPALTICYRADRDSSGHAANDLRSSLLQYRRENRQQLLRLRGFNYEPSEIGKISERDLATKDQASGLYVGRFLPLFMLFFLLIGGSAVAVDSIAGEKERGTLETLLTTAIRRSEIIGAKMLLVLSVSLCIAFLQVTNLIVYFGFKLIELPKGLSLAISPWTALFLLILFMPAILLVSGLLLYVSGISKTYKEAQLNFTPLFFAGILPATAPLFPALKLRSAMVLVPISNISLGIKEVLVGEYDWLMLALAWLVNAGAAVYVIRRLTNTLSQEKLITSSESDRADIMGGPELFPRRVYVWFGLMWVALLIIAGNVESLTSIWSQILVNVVLIFLGGSLFLIMKYRLGFREALALRPVRWPVWIAVLFGIPAALITSHGVFLLADLLIPVPKKMLESFGEYIFPPEYPVWLLVLLIAVLPGICEEVAFRGVFLYGIRRKYHPLVLPLVVGIVFGFFHMALFRLAPTAFLGILLTSVTLLTGSIFPAMLWHAGSNATALLLSRWKLSPEEFTWPYFVVAAVVLVLSFLVFWRFRTPYPGLKWRRGAGQADRRSGRGD